MIQINVKVIFSFCDGLNSSDTFLFLVTSFKKLKLILKIVEIVVTLNFLQLKKSIGEKIFRYKCFHEHLSR